MKQAEWYVDWFNSPYYHLLYNNRSEREAELLIDNLCKFLTLKENSKVWDMACGKGRHAIALNKKHLDVIGSDLSENSIAAAKLFENEHLHFFVHDMLKPFRAEAFDLVCNLFTSFGYFKTDADNELVFKNVAHSLKTESYFLIDYFNSTLVRSMVKAEHTEQRGSITFQISKQIHERRIVKRIEFSDAGHDYYFEESVDLLELKDFQGYANVAGFETVNSFGNYQLQPFDSSSSPRLILLFKKTT